MYGFTLEELSNLNRCARVWFGCDYLDLDGERQYEVYDYVSRGGEVE